MCFGMGKTRHPAQPIAKQNVPDARRVHPKDFPALILTYRAGNLHIKALSLSKNQISGKKEVIKMAFFTTAVTGLKTVVTAIGAGVGVWGVINLLEGYGNDNPGAKYLEMIQKVQDLDKKISPIADDYPDYCIVATLYCGMELSNGDDFFF